MCDSMQQNNGVYDLLKMLEISLEEGFPIIPRKFTVVKTKEIETLIDRIYASLPVEVQEARAFLRRREELQIEAQQKAEKIINSAQNIGFKNISCDIMIGLSGQSIEKLKLTIHKIAELSIQHFSAYILKIEENTPFNAADIINSLPDDDHISDLYLFMVEELQKLGYNQYEISNFSKMGFESKHNLKYWKCQEYIGLGPSAHSYFNGKRYFIPSDLNKYLNSTETILTDENPGSDDEKIMLGLRLTEGININDFPSRKALFLEKAKVFNKFNLIEIKNNFIKLTPKGFLVSNSIINEFI